MPAPLRLAAPATSPAPSPDLRRELARRLDRPQRHRLLQGYPMLPVMRSAAPTEGLGDVKPSRDRDLIVGVIPHPYCNPKVDGCGFCTFAHEPFRRGASDAVVRAVIGEIRARTQAPWLGRRRVSALYLGGGTANLTSPDALRALGVALDEAFDLGDAELSFEGVPVYFTARGNAALDAFESIPARHRRLSLGVQTFDPTQLRAMGREAFGDRDAIAGVVREAHARGMTASCDLLINLPGQDLPSMRRDVRTAIELGFDQVCVYHLVLFDGIGTEWSKDPAKLAALPSNEAAYLNWRQVRFDLLERGFVQASLTNFERAEVNGTAQRFQYEELSYAPEHTDGVGFGPGGITVVSDPEAPRAAKLVNEASAGAYRSQVDAHGRATARSFRYAARDARLLHLTRSLARGGVDRAPYRERFGSDVAFDFAAELDALIAARLVEVWECRVSLTERGLFFADSVAGLLAHRRIDQLRQRRRLGLPDVDPNDASAANMG